MSTAFPARSVPRVAAEKAFSGTMELMESTLLSV